uniref:Uncharacterized protein n=1 Tax=Kwoniella bestiolae CBS 10118 TaxID=1296100 RepID=A0A1B9G0Y0_9TREE|nr:hypothetical protein I302_06130 [Kwoniella bestiolae CBS 10118]OCF24669.1 hypothetical protein I302_06130 [Kwoniella bestiolae CBS 10118]
MTTESDASATASVKCQACDHILSSLSFDYDGPAGGGLAKRSSLDLQLRRMICGCHECSSPQRSHTVSYLTSKQTQTRTEGVYCPCIMETKWNVKNSGIDGDESLGTL